MALLDIRRWTLRFGTEYARRLRCTRGACSNIWNLDELGLMINGERGWLWRAVDDGGSRHVGSNLTHTPTEENKEKLRALLRHASSK